MRATLTYLEPRTALTPPTELAPLGPDDLDFMARHVEALREESAAADSLLSRFQAGSDVPGLFGQLTELSQDLQPAWSSVRVLSPVADRLGSRAGS